MVQWKFEHDVQNAEKVERNHSQVIAVRVDGHGAQPYSHNQRSPALRYLMPLDDRRLREPIEVVVRVGVGDQPHHGESRSRVVDFAQRRSGAEMKEFYQRGIERLERTVTVSHIITDRRAESFRDIHEETNCTQ